MLLWEPLNILSYGAGMPSTSLVGMACENAMQGYPVWPHVPVYDAVIFCDLHAEPTWVYEQADFAHRLCERAGIPFYTPVWRFYLQIWNEPNCQCSFLDDRRGWEKGTYAPSVHL